MDKVAAVLILWAFWQFALAPLLFGGTFDDYSTSVGAGLAATLFLGLAAGIAFALLWAFDVLVA